MFKKESFADEIMRGMIENLGRNKLKNKESFDNLSKAVDCLQVAAEIFDNTGLYAEAEELTTMLEKLADKKKALK